MAVKTRIALPLALAIALAWIAAWAYAASADARSIRWSGHTWIIRHSRGHANPGKNLWGGGPRNVRVQTDGSLRLAISHGRATELGGPSLGYGRYRWVVRSRLDSFDRWPVFALYTHDPTRRSPYGEQDLEIARWGSPSTAPIQAGSYVSWLDHKRAAYGWWTLSLSPPYTLDILWSVGRVDFSAQDALGVRLLSVSIPTTDSGRRIAPRMAYWLYPGKHGNTGGKLTRKRRFDKHPSIVLNSFRFTPLDKLS